MLRSLNLLLALGLLSPPSSSSLLRYAPPRRSLVAALSRSKASSINTKYLLRGSCARSRGDFKSHRMSSVGPDASSDSDVSAGAAVVPPMVHQSKIRFCHSCGNPTKQVIPDGEEKLRAVCTACGKIHYENPQMVVGCLVEHDDKVLLCKRKIEPSYGFWTLPAGFLEIGESAAEGAARETLEEACADVEIISPFAQIDIPRIAQSYIIFRAKLKTAYFAPGPESLDCALFALDDIPFESLAFSSVFVTLKMYIEDIKARNIKFHYCTINKRPGASPSDPHGFDMEYQLHVS